MFRKFYLVKPKAANITSLIKTTKGRPNNKDCVA